MTVQALRALVIGLKIDRWLYGMAGIKDDDRT